MVIWTPRARADLKAIHDYIAKDSPINAKNVARELLRKSESLSNVPHQGRVVPEINDPQLREIPAHSWRIIYRPHHGHIYIVTLIHKRRLVGTEEFGER